ncbi:SDR family NAD(P)-dependent oxidoreductase [uncultured Jatrophihabitans sp.]|uniref:SDR family NAD(P)-dependent oxidoreductase n=1 Tax=uncultured Jatrophihabitans sp. TaxID=1610747 RepID=UPI0035CB4ED6
MINLQGRTAIVTGGGRGIGASVARLLGRCGANVMIADLGAELNGTGQDAGPAASVAQRIRDERGAAAHNVCDVGNLTSVQGLFAETLEAFGTVDVVVNVAGNLRDRTLWNMTEDEWDSVIRVHLKGTFNTVSTAARHWKAIGNPDGNYRLINFISAAGIYGSFGQPNYAAAKMGIVGLTYSAAQSLARYGVTANMVAPVATTRMVTSIPGSRNILSDNEAMNPDSVAPIVAYLASERSAWSTGRIYDAGRRVFKVYGHLDTIAHIASEEAWDLDEFVTAVETTLLPAVANDPSPRERLRAELAN